MPDFLGRICGATTGSTFVALIIAAIGLIPIWVEREEKNATWWAGLLVFILSILAAGFTVKEEIESQDEAAELNRQLGESQAQVGKLLESNNAITARANAAEEKLAAIDKRTRQRTLTPEQKATMHAELAETPRGTVEVWTWTALGKEPNQFAQEIREFFKEEGFEVGSQVAVRIGPIGPPGVGVVVRVDAPQPPHRDQILNALLAARIPTGWDTSPKISAGVVAVFVGSNPHAAVSAPGSEATK